MKRFDMRAAVLSLVVALGGCGDAAMVAPRAPVEDLSSPDGALAALDHAEAEVGRALGRSPGLADAAAGAAPMAPPQPPSVQQAPSPPPPPPMQVQTSSAESRPRASAPAKAGPRDQDFAAPVAPAAQPDPCATACSALASMERATDHLCGLSGAGDARCQSARTRVKDATARVHASCPACAR